MLDWARLCCGLAVVCVIGSGLRGHDGERINVLCMLAYVMGGIYTNTTTLNTPSHFLACNASST